MNSGKICRIFPVLFLSVVLLLWVVPASAQDDGSVSVTYRGAGGYYLGDTIHFDGKNTLGNTTVIKITGPDLPAEGVPPFNLSGTAGTGNSAEVDNTGSWFFYWDTSRVAGADKFYTARYTFTVFDSNHPDVTASTSVMLKKPEFYATVVPNPATPDDYVLIKGNAETGVNTVEIDVMDSSGNTVHTFTSPVSSGGAFSFGFHVDMSPGEYTVKISSPSLAKSITRTLVVSASKVNATATNVTGTVTPSATVPVTDSPDVSAAPTDLPVTTLTAAAADGTGTLVISSVPSGATVYVDSVLAGTTPLTLNSVAAGAHTVEFRLPGYLTCSMNVLVTAGQTEQVSPELVQAPNGMPLSPLTAIAGCIGALGLLFAAGRRKE